MYTVLLLEEDREGREALARVLKRRGLTVVQTMDVSTALVAIASSLPLDLVIAGSSGRDRTDFLAGLRESRPHLPVLFLTDYCSSESRLRGLVFGPFITARPLNFSINTRPIGLDELDRMIWSILEKRRRVHRSGHAA